MLKNMVTEEKILSRVFLFKQDSSELIKITKSRPEGSSNDNVQSLITLVTVNCQDYDLRLAKQMVLIPSNFVNDRIKLEWGNDYYTWNDLDIGKFFVTDFNTSNNFKITDSGEAKRFATLNIYEESYNNVANWCMASLNYGYTWYFENGNYYFQLVFLQFCDTGSPQPIAKSTINLGYAVKFS
ncbi:hypothetical protein CXP39_02990 [Mesoplasma syrphidae]|uniref:Uncharacterized protein n=1 Tax=Mesoplasma syrphidae TaxID=225999 RepID=A0A2K9BKK1_9MOLU|nr:hypothetical protein [Mesoplasma syrphidae]AUF83751.1 hypothetical protein CXP39_02990 [Mesoplasma syrphidae]